MLGQPQARPKPIAEEPVKRVRDPNKLFENNRNHEHENSSCKNTVKMTDRREFSFLDSQKESNVPLNNNHKNLLSRKPNEFWTNKPETNEIGGIWGSVNDTVSRLHAINSQQVNKPDAMIFISDEKPLNPFIHESQMFMANSETNIFGHKGGE